ncbi:MAG: methyltransferase domain-containing protein [Dehalococcoidia bacterium]|nr:MAG: methyltransferase domain-containing protein [Dehalococcoidia bacterium]
MKVSACAVCGGPSTSVIALPQLPLTGLYLRPGHSAPATTAADQELLLCDGCGHAQLGRALPPEILYAGDYTFRTAASHCAQSGTAFFTDFLERVAPGRRFRHAVDIGCNDLHLLRQIGGRVGARTGIDPVWADAPPPVEPGVVVLGATVEAVDLTALEGGPVDLVLCRHTLEHVPDPRAVIRQALDAVAADGLLVFEVPGFDRLLGRLRFDQIFHHHLQYFSRASLFRLLAECGGEYVASVEHPQHWGAILIAFRRASGESPAAPSAPVVTRAGVLARYAQFRRLAEATGELLTAATLPVAGYGAAQLLPNLAYHLGGLGAMEVVLDDDESKDGWRYANLPLTVRHPSNVPGWRDGTVVITALDNATPILRRLLGDQPRDTLLPLSYI